MFPSAAEQSVVCLSVNCEVQRISRPKHSDFTLKCEKGGEVVVIYERVNKCQNELKVAVNIVRKMAFGSRFCCVI